METLQEGNNLIFPNPKIRMLIVSIVTISNFPFVSVWRGFLGICVALQIMQFSTKEDLEQIKC